MNDPAQDAPEMREDRLLGGRVRLRQPADGLRAGLDAVMLAAAVPARPGERVLELGTGSGPAALCLLARVPGSSVVAVERDAGLAALAAENLALNGWSDRGTVRQADIVDRAALRDLPIADHGMANPPYWEDGRASPDARRAAAMHECAAVPLLRWTAALSRGVRRGGTGVLILPASRLLDGLGALREVGFGSLAVLPLWPRAGEAARRVLLLGRVGGRGPDRVLPGLVLHHGRDWTGEAQAILRDAAPLPGLSPLPRGGAGARAVHAPPPGSPCSCDG
ncbi:tRNA1(Val) (adenine(37)-N6)-methyltransferase [Roseomonas elaeocarpi]|uniref:tRNA1(Val) (Adenine(37)-N6)-methyltransferase n=1 Tax=Roseomonas elaeocarpi TaxID=907779 RepID=A0ABV6JVT2_9PROT